MEVSSSASCLGTKTTEGEGGNYEETTRKNAQPLVSFMECPVCYDISLPLLQCSNGHIICETCWESLSAKTCPTCRCPMYQPSRNIALEQIILNFDTELACKFAVNGCPKKMLFPQKEAHQATCHFKNYDCPLVGSGCKWTGRLTDVVQHLKGRERDSHAVPALYGESATFYFVIDPDVEGQTHLAIQIQSCFDSFFMIAFRTTYCINSGDGPANVEYSALVQHIGLKEETKKFAYRMELVRDGRRLCWEAVPLSITEEIRRSFDKGDCLTFNLKTMLLFKSEDIDMIPIDVTINKL